MEQTFTLLQISSSFCLVEKPIYYLPGRGGSLDQGLGSALKERKYKVSGRELQGSFRNERFDDQVSIVAEDLRTKHWRTNALVVANSFGAYLFLHAQAELPAYPGRVLLLSPILGSTVKSERGFRFIPPRAEKLFELAVSGRLMTPMRCEIHVGSDDWQSNPDRVVEFGELTSITVNIAYGMGHLLEKGYVSRRLDAWLENDYQ